MVFLGPEVELLRPSSLEGYYDQGCLLIGRNFYLAKIDAPCKRISAWPISKYCPEKKNICCQEYRRARRGGGTWKALQGRYFPGNHLGLPSRPSGHLKGTLTNQIVNSTNPTYLQLIHKCHTAVASPHLPESRMPPTPINSRSSSEKGWQNSVPLETFWKHSGRFYWSPGDISWRVGNKTSLSPSDSHPWRGMRCIEVHQDRAVIWNSYLDTPNVE